MLISPRRAEWAWTKEGLVALAVALGLAGADRAAALEAGDDALGGHLAEMVGVEAAREVDRAGAGAGADYRASRPL